MAVGLLNGRPCRGADVREEEGRLDMSGDLAQVAIVPGWHEASKKDRRVGADTVPTYPEPVPIGGVPTEPRMKTLIDQGMLGFVEQFLEGDRRS